MRAIGLALCAMVILSWSGRVEVTRAQVEIDRTLERIYGVPIMASDVRQARLLHLFAASEDSDRAIQTALENRLLVLREVTRGGSQQPASSAVAERRRSWSATLPPGFDVEAVMVRAGMNADALDTWFGDDVRIDEYLTRRFGQAADPRRAGRIDEWVRDLRRRAGLERLRP